MFGSGGALLAWFTIPNVHELDVKLGVAVFAGAIVGLQFVPVFVLASCAAWRASLTEIQLAIKWRTPVRLMDFLNDAHDRNVLRAVGSTYQFRHARLQDRLAAVNCSSVPYAPSQADLTKDHQPSPLVPDKQEAIALPGNVPIPPS